MTRVVRCQCSQWRRQDLMRGTQSYMKLFVAHKMTRNNALNKVHLAATELPQLLSQKTNTFGETTARRRCQILCSPKVN